MMPGRSSRGSSVYLKDKNLRDDSEVFYDPTGTRTPVAGMKTQCPRPLDDGASTGKTGRHFLRSADTLHDFRIRSIPHPPKTGQQK